jgi:cathepsin B
MAMSDAFIAEVNSIPGSWVAGVNGKFVGMTLEEAKRFMGTRRDPKRRAALPLSTLKPLSAAAIPTNFNATSAFPQCASTIGHIRDQSDCGCCW